MTAQNFSITRWKVACALYDPNLCVGVGGGGGGKQMPFLQFYKMLSNTEVHVGIITKIKFKMCIVICVSKSNIFTRVFGVF